MSDSIRKILIVGGGTSGWLTAAILAKKLASFSENFEVSLVESSDIPTIGVGEGTFPTMLDTLQYIGISEPVFMSSCQATFKQGIEFVNWMKSTDKNLQHSYYHLFNPPAQAKNIDLVQNWVNCRGEKPDFAHAVSAQSFICDQQLSPKLFNSPEYQYKTRYAYHLDAGKFVALLKKHATEQLMVKHHIATITQVIQSSSGEISSVITQEGNSLEADLFVDCSGFASLLIGKTLNTPFKDLSDILFVDHAVAIQVPYASDKRPIASQTISTAHEAGWTWDIGLAKRQGIGYVYSSRYTNHDRADQLVREYAAQVADSTINIDELETRKIPMRVGYRETSWVKNCVAIGFSGGFVEPLEATAISMVETAAMMLAGQFPKNKKSMQAVAKKFNQVFQLRWEKIVEFIKLHYCLSNRADNQFWLDNCAEDSIPDGLKEKLALWKHFPPQDNDFASRFEMFSFASYQYVLYGMQFKTDYSFPFSDEAEKIAQNVFSAIEGQGKQALNELPAHRHIIDYINNKTY